MVEAHIQIIGLWDSHEALAKDVGANAAAVRKWRQRRRIPPAYWAAIVKTKTAKEQGVTLEKLSAAIVKTPVKNRSAA